MGWDETVPTNKVYLNDRNNGATLLSIALGHAADALCYCLGEIRDLSATMTMRRKSFTIAGTGESKPMHADDQVCVAGLLERDRKSTRLNSSHVRISYAVFCLKKKKS